jgi:hypothetical protein
LATPSRSEFTASSPHISAIAAAASTNIPDGAHMLESTMSEQSEAF